MADLYKAKLKQAAWTWMERAYCRKYDKRLKKDRVSGRHAKRSARQADRLELIVEMGG